MVVLFCEVYKFISMFYCIVRNFGSKNFGKLQAIRQSIFAKFPSLYNRIVHGFVFTHGETYGLSFMVEGIFPCSVYRHRAFGTVVTIECISITN